MAAHAIWKHKLLNSWWLFALISVPMCAFIIFESLATDLTAGEGVSHMIGYSVRWGIPFIYLVVAASSFNILFPGPFSKWWVRNRKFIGLCFAVAMFWQGLYIFIISTVFRDYYFESVYYFRDELEGTVGYVFLAFMVLTSFEIGRRRVNPLQWKLIQKGGVYFLWAYPFSVYWWNLFYYPTLEGYSAPDPHDYVLYWTGFAAFALRIFAWGKRRSQKNASGVHGVETPTPMKGIGYLLVLFGLYAATNGDIWQKTATSLLTESQYTAISDLVLWLPFWPLEPFLPLLIMALGIQLATSRPRTSELQAA
ncbi:MAG: hypothetical protein JJ850_12220 [Kordiimonadaceae bacterium]|nr:hypothetical protein [Kordiimonadaceae bacterium]MBO6568644.1 hypothetical protein [Kordiimonadaceae bacterium]MBO6965380.1 hypothetical protein [Kordiimonadaceae bacterium]